jgi:surface protein
VNNGIFVQDVYIKAGFDNKMPCGIVGIPLPVTMPYHYFGQSWKTNNRYFTFVVDTSLMSSDTISILLAGAGGLFYADWGDGIVETYPSFSNSTISHTYNSKSIYLVQLIGNIYAPRLTTLSLIQILSFGDVLGVSALYTQAFRFNTNLKEVPKNIPTVPSNFTQAFNGCTNLNDPNIALWNMTNANTIDNIFNGCALLNQDLGSWNTSSMTTMTASFAGATNFNNGGFDSINNWNTANVTSMSSMFQSAVSFNQPLNNWNVSKVTSFTNMFNGARSFNQSLNGWQLVSSGVNCVSMFFNATSFNQNLGTWNTSGITNVSSMFNTATSFTGQGIDSWILPSVTTASNMFLNCFNLAPTGSLSGWGMGNCTDMSRMFYSAGNNVGSNFSGLNSWNTSSCTNMSEMFFQSRFNNSLSNWNVRKVTNFANMFDGAIALNSSLSGWALGADTAGASCVGMFQNSRYNQSLSDWDTSKVTNMSNMFAQQLSVSGFNQDIGSWNTSSVTNMGLMFYNNYYFNNGGSSSINNWNTSNVIDMNNMFYQALVFNQPIGNWNVSKVRNMSFMFYRANVFNQDISSWNLAGINANTGLDSFMLDKTGVNAISTTNYDALLIGWNNNKLLAANGVANWRTDLRPNFGGAKYTAGGAAATARAALVSYGWTITDGGVA